MSGWGYCKQNMLKVKIQYIPMQPFHNKILDYNTKITLSKRPTHNRLTRGVLAFRVGEFALLQIHIDFGS